MEELTLNDLFKEYDIAMEDVYLNSSLDLVTESLFSNIGSSLKNIKDILAAIINYIKNLHPIRRKIIYTLLKELRISRGIPTTGKLFQLLETSDVGLLYLCDYDLRNIPKLESAIFELYYQFGVSPNPENTMHSLYLKFDINSNLQRYITDKVREWARNSEYGYSRHQIITINTRGNIIYILTIIYDKNQKEYIEEFKFIVPEEDRKIKDKINIEELHYLAPMLLDSHLKSLDRYRWVTTKIDKELKSNIYNQSPSVSKLSMGILKCVHDMSPKFYILATEVARSLIKK